MAAFAAQLRQEFERTAIKRLMEVYPDECQEMGPDKVTGFVAEGTERAIGYDIEEEGDILAFLYFAMENGEAFDTDPAFTPCGAILGDSSLPGQAKIEMIYELFGGSEE